MVIGNNIISENLIIVKELINTWQIASTSKKKKIFFLKNMGQLDPTRNPTQPATRLTRNPIDPTRPACFAMSRRNQTQPKMVESYI